MIKIDLHIHTIATISDSAFEFSISTFERYVREASLDAVAITNHNLFDFDQFQRIQIALAAQVLPGIEVNLESCHVLLIAAPERANRLALSSEKLSAKIQSASDSISVAELKEVFGDLAEYLIIPHYEKKPAIRPALLEQLSPFVTAGEVDSPKKFLRCAKDDTKLVPVLFSDSRMATDLEVLPSRSTYLGCGEPTLSAIKETLKDRSKVFLSGDAGNDLFPVLGDGTLLSTGLNVFLGDRSSGKTHTLNRICSEQPNVKYLRQFSLVQLDETQFERDFNAEIERRRSGHTEEYLRAFKAVVDEIAQVDLDSGNRSFDGFIELLLKSAHETDRMDSFSKARLFSESTFKLGEDKTLSTLIEAVRHLIENVDQRATIERHVSLSSLRSLAIELIETLWERTADRRKKELVNEVVEDTRKQLAVRTSATQVPDLDLYAIAMDRKRVRRFEEIVHALREEHVIYEKEVQGFTVVARTQPFRGAGELKAISGKKTAFSEAFDHYDDPYEYLQQLLAKSELADSEHYRFFVRIVYEILNKDGYQISGGERSEFRLLQEISDAQSHDMLLIDEPESSFDNMFLKGNVNALIRDIARTMPVVVVTHNSTVGASIGADYVLCARKEVASSGRVYKLYSGYPTDRSLRCKDGSEIPTHEVLLSSLEAGLDAYERRRASYEAVKDP
ncbi:hypothetical protein [Gemmatimonas aurantiaca]|uniref:hypothetical protein n=1 Tax=Gemmatimonas aurantiaca TaxID=173480 RepID=UPI00301DF8C2